MQVKLVGIQKISFINSNGETVNGTKVHCMYKDPNIEGFAVEKFFLKEEIKLPECKVNDNIELVFNMKGKVENVYKA